VYPQRIKGLGMTNCKRCIRKHSSPASKFYQPRTGVEGLTNEQKLVTTSQSVGGTGPPEYDAAAPTSGLVLFTHTRKTSGSPYLVLTAV
jgi:hypothetical protein